MKNKLVSLLCATAMIVSALTGCGSQGVANEESKNSSVAESKTESSAAESTETVESEYPEYLNLDSGYPIIKDEYKGTIKLTAIIRKQAGTGNWEDLWVKKYLEDKYNIELDVEWVDGAAVAERKSLMLNSGDMPDLILDMKFTTTELVKYAQGEGLFLKCDEYMNETLTPNILKYWDERVEKACTLPDGHVYSLPYITDDVDVNPDSVPRMSINKKMLADVGLEIPKTLDEFVDALYKLKEADLTGVGSENFYPLSGGMDTSPASWYLLNAFGYVITKTDGYGLLPSLRDGEVVIPAYDMNVFQEYLKLMNQLYNDGIINPNYFTVESTETNAQVLEGKTATFAENVSVISMPEEQTREWVAAHPLISDWQEEPEVYWPNNISVGGFLINAETEYPELCMRIADMYFNNETDACSSLYFGVEAGSEYDYEGGPHWTFDPERGYEVKNVPEGVSDWNYTLEKVAGYMPKIGIYNTRASKGKMLADAGYEYRVVPKWDPEIAAINFYMRSLTEYVTPYVAESYPAITWVDEDTALEISALETVITPYIKEQVALFIAGNRPLSETSAFVEELKGMGADKLLQYYKDIYNSN